MIATDISEMRALLPILNEIDEASLSRLDNSEWFRPSAAQARRLAAAADRMGVFLMAYRANCRAAVGDGLCNLIAAAELDAVKLDEIASLESACPDAAIVAYERPIRQRH
ncbi:hypothetical protein [Bradyrhizobium australiense]|uniref:Uncharacterized protein n=1 Tax=Bradyrhizobium australiense TaxID=2721161 RepID=A0A7Y4GRN2_9BRAD|nr:hypothetical protein [Bradyrhizobium australiense]NOJ40492.1 hypothetical protein [Bradyrhizobium australiense]